MNNSVWLFIVILIVAIFIIVKIRKKVKKIRLDNVVMINGGVKCGKTSLTVHFGQKTYRRNFRQVRFINFFRKLFHKELLELPLLYSNIPLKAKYVPLTTDLLLRQTRFAYKSVCIISESSLTASSNDYKNEWVNERLTYFVKLFGHETKGGSLFIETQSLNDNHYSFKRGINRYYWIQTLNTRLPFVLVYRLREMVYSDGDGSISNNFNTDSDDTMKILIVSKKVWKLFDCYCYSKMTDNRPVENNVIDNRYNSDLKTDTVLSIKDCQYYKGVNKNDKQKD